MGFSFKASRRNSAISKHCQSTYHDTLNQAFFDDLRLVFTSDRVVVGTVVGVVSLSLTT